MPPEEDTGGGDVEVGEGSEGIGGLQRCGVEEGQLLLVGTILGDQGQLETWNHW